MDKIIEIINGVFWDYFLVFLLGFCGLYFTLKLNFVQIRHFKKGLSVFGNKSTKTEGVTPFQALMASISAQVGTGNIAGVSLALVFGGPGAIFWMWISAFLGMATIFAEATLAQKYKVTINQETTGGPSYYIEKSLGKFTAKTFSIIAIFALGIIGSMVQSNSVANSFETAFNLNPLFIGITISVASSFVFFGGVKRLAKVTEKLVPIMAITYIIGAIIVIFTNKSNILSSVQLIINNAFKIESITGFGVGITAKKAIRYGISRGLFSNEAGMGSTPHAHALAQCTHPCNQGIVAIIGVFIDTFVILNITAFAILTTFNNFDDLLQSGYKGVNLAQFAFSSVLGEFGVYFIAICMLFFGFSSILGLYLFGEMNVKYAFGKKYIKLYSLIVLITIVIGSISNIDTVWSLADMLNGFLVIPNVLSLIILSDDVLKLSKEFDKKRR